MATYTKEWVLARIAKRIEDLKQVIAAGDRAQARLDEIQYGQDLYAWAQDAREALKQKAKQADHLVGRFDEIGIVERKMLVEAVRAQRIPMLPQVDSVTRRAATYDINLGKAAERELSDLSKAVEYVKELPFDTLTPTHMKELGLMKAVKFRLGEES